MALVSTYDCAGVDNLGGGREEGRGGPAVFPISKSILLTGHMTWKCGWPGSWVARQYKPFRLKYRDVFACMCLYCCSSSNLFAYT